MSELKQWILWSMVGTNFAAIVLISSAILDIRRRLIVLAEQLDPLFPVLMEEGPPDEIHGR